MGEAYVSSRGCVLCGGARSSADGLKKRRTRDVGKQREYYKKWYKKHGHHYNTARAREYSQRPEAVESARLRGVAREIRDLQQLALSARRWSAKIRFDPVRRFAQRLREGILRRSPTRVDWDVEWLETQIREHMRAGLVNVDRESPECASVDQRIAGLGYHKANVQVVPRWYNFAKWQWTDADITDAVTKWVCARALGE